MAKIDINFIGPWRLFLGVKTIRAEVNDIEEAKIYVEANYRPVFEQKLQSMGVNKKESVWENSTILINGKKISLSDNTFFKDGDRLDLLPLVAGG
ncbi:MAG: MoaD/ThiS family protein [Deltaproteobacteria bacterium]|nr:MoaD/ThiS family protein [Deltaproteobacteria bacterium]MBW1847444.1 MoaD/ThiS family protein [Deltaproteobacteria bacterium]